jgi:hypothetical protein
MSDTSQGPGWWQASDGKWYPPADTEQPGPGWWLASDGNWYPPEQRMPVKPVAKPARPNAAAPAPARAATTDLGTPAGPAVAPTPPTPTPAAPVASSPAATPEPDRSPGFGAPVKPVAAAPKGPDAAPATPPAGPRPPGPDARATLSGGLSPDLQIRVRNEQSRRDAAVLFDARKSAATRALGNISALLEQEQASAPREQRESGAARAVVPPPAVDPQAPPPGRASTPVAPKSKGKMGRVIKAGRTEPAGPADLPPAAHDRRVDAPVAESPPVVVADDTPAAPSEPPLLEVKQGTLAADIEHIGERLVIFNDRVELHDRNDRVRQVIAGGDIADVVVHKKFTGSTVTVESGTGESIVAKGLKPEQADEIRSVILKRTRAGAPSAPLPVPPVGGTRSTAARGRTEPLEPIVDARDPKPAIPPTPAEAAALVAKLDDLHRAGVLTDAELAEKKALVERLTHGETLAVSSPSA